MLETPRLVIREMCPDDIDVIYSIYEDNNLEYMENLYDDRSREYEYIKDYQKYIYNFYDFGIWLFEDKKTGEIIGRGGAEYKLDEAGNRNAELGYIIKKNSQRQGYAFEALSAILDYIAEYFDVPEVRAVIHPENTASVHLIGKLGFAYDSKSDGMDIYKKKLLF